MCSICVCVCVCVCVCARAWYIMSARHASSNEHIYTHTHTHTHTETHTHTHTHTPTHTYSSVNTFHKKYAPLNWNGRLYDLWYICVWLSWGHDPRGHHHPHHHHHHHGTIINWTGPPLKNIFYTTAARAQYFSVPPQKGCHMIISTLALYNFLFQTMFFVVGVQCLQTQNWADLKLSGGPMRDTERSYFHSNKGTSFFHSFHSPAHWTPTHRRVQGQWLLFFF